MYIWYNIFVIYKKEKGLFSDFPTTLRALADQFKSVSTVWIGTAHVTSTVYLPTNCVRDA